MANFTRQFPPQEHPGLIMSDDHWDALEGSDALLILTEWETYREASPAEIARRLAGDLVVDGRNLLDPDAAAATGLRYRGVGRKGR
jgi:UDPglucose 6-dehydrogenase